MLFASKHTLNGLGLFARETFIFISIRLAANPRCFTVFLVRSIARVPIGLPKAPCSYPADLWGSPFTNFDFVS